MRCPRGRSWHSTTTTRIRSVSATGGVATQLAKHLADPAPYDLSDVDLAHYRRLDARWRDWENVVRAARELAADVRDTLAQEG